jgi:hypothetical protein
LEIEAGQHVSHEPTYDISRKIAYLRVDTVELLLREDSEKVPGEIQTLEDSSRFVRA